MFNANFEKYSQHPRLLYKLLSTGNVRIHEHTVNDTYWGDGGGGVGGLNKLGAMLERIRILMFDREIRRLAQEYKRKHRRWIVQGLHVLENYNQNIVSPQRSSRMSRI
jgi:hypothetical protein